MRVVCDVGRDQVLPGSESAVLPLPTYFMQLSPNWVFPSLSYMLVINQSVLRKKDSKIVE